MFTKNPLRLPLAGGSSSRERMLKVSRGNGELFGAIITLARRSDYLWNVTRLQQRGNRRCRESRVLYNTYWERVYTIAYTGCRSYPTETISSIRYTVPRVLSLLSPFGKRRFNVNRSPFDG